MRTVFGWRNVVALCAVVAIAVVGGSSARAGNIITVCASSCDHTTIQDAINAATSGDTIDVTGNYDLTSTVNVTQPVIIQGEAGATVTANGLSSAFSVTASGVTIEDFSFSAPDHTTNTGFIGLLPGADNSTITGNHFTGGYSLGDSEVTRGLVVSPGVTGLSITGNHFESIRQPAYLDNGDSGTISGNYAAVTKGWVVGAQSSLSFTSNTWGSGSNRNAVDIAIITNASSSDSYSDILALSQANNNAVIDNQYERTMSTVYVDASAAGGGNGYWNSPFQTVQDGVNAAVAGGTVNVAAGTYAENVSISKALTLDGAGSTSSGTVISPASGNGITVAGSGTDTSNPLTVENLRVTTSGGDGVYFNNAVSHIAMDNVAAVNNNYGIEVHNSAVISDLSLTNVAATSNSVGFRVGTTGSVNGLTVSDSSFDGNTGQGWYITADSGSTSNQNDFTNVSVTNTTFNNDVLKGVYAEKLDHATFDGVTVNNSGTSGTFSSGFNVNEKYGAYQGVTVKNSTVSSSGTGDTTNGTGFNIEARDDGSYSSNQATLSGVTLSNDTVAGNQVGVRFGETGKNNAGPTNVSVTGSTISGNAGGSVINQTQATVTATNNWWGSASGPGTLTSVTTAPWATDSSFATQSNNADLTGLAVSAGTLNPSFSSSTTSYTASVDNSVSSFSITPTANPGATTLNGGGSSLPVGSNTKTVKVTSADGSATKTYTITISRAAAVSSGGGGAPATTTVVPPPPPPPAPPVVPPVNVAQKVVAAPGKSGSVAVSVAPVSTTPGGTAAAAVPVSVALSWSPAAFTVPVTVQMTPKPQTDTGTGTGTGTGGTAATPLPVAGGFAVGNTVVQVTVTTAAGVAVTEFAAPLVIQVSSLPAGQVPAYSHDGTSWTTIPKLAGPELPDGQPDGYFVNTDGSVDIYTRHATLFGLLLDTQAPARPVVQARLTGSKLRLTVRSRDNVRLASYRVSVNGKLIRRTTHAYLVFVARAGSFQVVAVDTAGNRSKASSTIVVTKTHNKRQPYTLQG